MKISLFHSASLLGMVFLGAAVSQLARPQAKV